MPGIRPSYLQAKKWHGMADANTTLAQVRDAWRRFVAERSWEPFHTPKNLTMGLAVEVGELMEHFLWMDNDASWLRRALVFGFLS